MSHSQSVDPDESRTSTLFEKLEGAIKEETECIYKTAQTSRAISRSITKEFEVFEATGVKTAKITKTAAALESIPPTSVVAERAFSAEGLFITRHRTRLCDKNVNCLGSIRAYLKSKCFVFFTNN